MGEDSSKIALACTIIALALAEGVCFVAWLLASLAFGVSCSFRLEAMPEWAQMGCCFALAVAIAALISALVGMLLWAVDTVTKNREGR